MSVLISTSGQPMTQNDYYETIKNLLKWEWEDGDIFNKTRYKGWTFYVRKDSTDIWGPYTTIDNWWKKFDTVEEALEYIDNLEVT